MASYRPTTAQLELIRQLLAKLELRTRNVCLMHRPHFEKAGIWSAADLDRPLDQVLSDLTQGQASRLISALVPAVNSQP